MVIERQDVAGGAAMTGAIAPGYRVPSISHALGPLSRDVVMGLRLDRAGLEFITPDPALTSLCRDGRALVFHRDDVLTAAAINAFSTADAGRWIEFTRALRRVAGVIARLNREAPPEVETAGWWNLAAIGRHARALDRRDRARLLQWMPMAVADLTQEWFETDAVCAALAAHAVFGNPAGPRSAGTGSMLLGRVAADDVPVGSGVTVRGGPAALADTLAKMIIAAGGTIRTGVRVAKIIARGGQATGVVLDDGDVVQCRGIVAAIAPKTVLTELVPIDELPPTVVQRARNIRARGVTAKVNLALDALPPFTALGPDTAPLGGRLLIAPGLDYLERAFDATKYGAISDRPWLSLAIPSIADPSLAPDGGHVMSINAHFAPRHLRDTTWAASRDALASRVLSVLEPHAPTLARHIVAREVITPEDLETRWGVPGGHIFHGETTLDQWWAARPFVGWSRYRTPLAGLYLASAGVHPGGGLTGLPGWLAAGALQRDVGSLKKRRSASM
jgi:phytoene dehydrogenase-like protein